MLWIILLFLNSVVTDDSMEKFKLCNNEACILMQCYFPVGKLQRIFLCHSNLFLLCIAEFLNATQNEIKLFENFIELNHIFISYVSFIIIIE